MPLPNILFFCYLLRFQQQKNKQQYAVQRTVLTLVGRLRDQAELSGVLDSLYGLHLPILKVGVAD